jgi:hypothetical protein
MKKLSIEYENQGNHDEGHAEVRKVMTSLDREKTQSKRH